MPPHHPNVCDIFVAVHTMASLRGQVVKKVIIKCFLFPLLAYSVFCCVTYGILGLFVHNCAQFNDTVACTAIAGCEKQHTSRGSRALEEFLRPSQGCLHITHSPNSKFLMFALIRAEVA